MIWRFQGTRNLILLLLSHLGGEVALANTDLAKCIDTLDLMDKKVNEETEDRVLEKVAPKYPNSEKLNMSLRRIKTRNVYAQYVGCVALKFDIGPDGRSRETKVLASIPTGVFDRVSKNAIEKFLFSFDNTGQNKGVYIFNFSVESDPTTGVFDN